MFLLTYILTNSLTCDINNSNNHQHNRKLLRNLVGRCHDVVRVLWST